MAQLPTLEERVLLLLVPRITTRAQTAVRNGELSFPLEDMPTMAAAAHSLALAPNAQVLQQMQQGSIISTHAGSCGPPQPPVAAPHGRQPGRPIPTVLGSERSHASADAPHSKKSKATGVGRGAPGEDCKCSTLGRMWA
jgi:hypothetical protein